MARQTDNAFIPVKQARRFPTAFVSPEAEKAAEQVHWRPPADTKMNILLAMSHRQQLQLVHFFLSRKMPTGRIAACESFEDYWNRSQDTPPAVIILAYETLEKLAKTPAHLPRELAPGASLIVIAQKASALRMRKARRLGALGYLTHQARSEELLVAIHETSRGKFYCSSNMTPILVRDWIGLRTNRILAKESLQDREFQVLLHYTRGLNLEQISRSLQMSPKTVDQHLQSILGMVHKSNHATQNPPTAATPPESAGRLAWQGVHAIHHPDAHTS